MTYTVDKIIENYAVLENSETHEMIDVNINLLPKEITEGSILKLKNNIYYLDKSLEQQKRLSIQEKFNKLRNKTT